jgi:hypothetical protein
MPFHSGVQKKKEEQFAQNYTQNFFYRYLFEFTSIDTEDFHLFL